MREMPDHLRVIVALAAYAGLRLEEACHLKWSDIDMTNGELEFEGKGRKRRRVPISDELHVHLSRHPRRLGSRYVCPNPAGVPYADIRASLDSAAKRAGVEDRVRMHALRHAFASHMQLAGVSPRQV